MEKDVPQTARGVGMDGMLGGWRGDRKNYTNTKGRNQMGKKGQ